MEDGEGQGYVEDNSDESWANSHVETADTVLLVDLAEAVSEASELRRVNSLHLSLHDVHGVVRHAGAEAGETTREQVNDHLVGDVVCEGLLGVLKHDEPDSLVR